MATTNIVSRVLVILAMAACITLAGCSKRGPQGARGASGSPGTPGSPGASGTPGVSTVDVVASPPASLTGEITSVKISSPPVVQFTVKDEEGRGAIGLKAGASGNVRFTIAKLVLGQNGNSSRWQSYVNRTATSDNKMVKVTQATYEREGALVDHGDGTYTYTFANDVTAAKDPVTGGAILYEPALTHRVALQISSKVPIVNATYDFVPNGSTALAAREIAATASCNECHGQLVVHGSRYEVKYCVTCHNPGTTDANNGNTADMAVMVHKIHAAAVLNSPYELAGNSYAEVGYPQDVRNCRKCHDGSDAATPDGDNWKKKPTAEVCGSCHDDVVFVEPVPAGKLLHSGGVQEDNKSCAFCHSAANMELYHRTENSTPNNPNLPVGLSKMAYEIVDVTVNATNQPVVNFRILRDGVALDFLHLPQDLTGSPSFLVCYALPQDGVDAPADYNQRGKNAGQPDSVSIANLIAGTAGTLVAGADGVFTATLNATFPAGAIMRAIALQGYFTQKVAVHGGTQDIGRHTYSVIKPVTGDAVRREVVDTQKCLKCHEIFEGHGGNRVSNVAVCVTCHNPNLSSSGRTVTAPNATIISQLGSNPLTYPEDTNNMRDMIHGIHASHFRTTDYEFVRNRSNGLYYNWSEITFPGDVRDCLICHKEGTYDLPLPAGVLMTTVKTTTGNENEDLAAILAVRKSVPNATDVVTTPISSTCTMCHDSDAAKVHMRLNGGFIHAVRSEVPASNESCAVCHGSGRTEDVVEAHGN